MKRSEPIPPSRDDDTPWLSEMVDEELLVLFSEDTEDIARGVLHLLRLATIRPDVEEQLVDLIDAALEHSNDDAQAATWATVILAELGSSLGIGVIQRALLAENDETLQNTAAVALLRLGSRGLDAVMETIEETQSPTFNRHAYRVLANTGVLEDPDTTQRVTEFLEERVPIERGLPPQDRVLEELADALARVGARENISVLKEILAEEFQGSNCALEDSIAMLEENDSGDPIGAHTPPWEELYGWMFERAAPSALLERDAGGDITIDLPFGETTDPSSTSPEHRSSFLRGLNVEPREKPDEET